MKMKRIWELLVATSLAGCASIPDDQTAIAPAEPIAAENHSVARLSAPPPEADSANQQVLFWTEEQRAQRFREMEEWFPGLIVEAAPNPRPLPEGDPLPRELASDLQAFMRESDAAGLLVLQDGKVRFEEYGLGFGPEERWTSFSVAKSFTSTLLGAAVKDGAIASLDDNVARYIPELQGSAYDGVTVRQLATMTSGIAWNEDYTDPDSDVARMQYYLGEFGGNAIVAQMKELEREALAGSEWVYKTGETNLLGLLVERATGEPLASYAKRKIVDPAGFAGPLFWMIYPDGTNVGGCCLSIRLSDYARMGQFALEGGVDIVPEGWFEQAGAPASRFGNGFGYGYQWWTYPGGAYGAQGIFGQAITIVPDEDLVVAVVSNWPSATSDELRSRWRSLVDRIARAK